MPLAEATALVYGGNSKQKKMAPLCLEPLEPQADRLALERLAQRCQQYSPSVGLEDADLPETLLLEVIRSWGH